MENTAIKSATTKMSLAEKTEAYNEKVHKQNMAKAVEYVENSLIPALEDQANRGRRFLVACPPRNLVLKDVISALTERVECSAKPNGLKGRINVSW